MTSRFSRTAFAVAMLVAASACTVKKTEAPPVSGPSELGTAVTLQALPDTLPQDGASQSQIVVQARDANNGPVRSLAVRIDITVNGIVQDFGQLSSRNVSTGSDGRTSVIYTAPKAADTVDHATVVSLRVTPVGSDAAAQTARFVDIRLVPPGVITPPVGVAPDFTVSPDAPLVLQTVSFEAESDADITNYSWTFGDGGSATGRIVSHQYARAGSFPVTLSATRNDGVVGTRSKSIDVGAGDAPVASFVFSPSSPGVAETVFFNGASSTATPPRRVTKYQWDFGDGKGGGGTVTSHKFTKSGDFNVTLTVTDDSGQKGVTSNTVTVGEGSEGGLEADFTFSPTDPVSGSPVSFNSSASTSSSDPIVQYTWDFGDGSATVNTTNKIVNHTFGATGTYTVTLTVKDSKGRTQLTSKTVSVG
jgi:PKD repeat protein